MSKETLKMKYVKSLEELKKQYEGLSKDAVIEIARREVNQLSELFILALTGLQDTLKAYAEFQKGTTQKSE